MAKQSDIREKIKKRITDLPVRSPEDVAQLFSELRAVFDPELAAAVDADSLEALRIRWLGRAKTSIRRSVLDNWLKIESPFRREVGQGFRDLLSDTEGYVDRTLAALRARFEAKAEPQREAVERLDLSLPGNLAKRGARHLITQTLEEMEDIFIRIGFSVVEGPEIETSYYNFEALNLPEFHPARDTMATLYLSPDSATALGAGLLLRTHTSPVQVRVMEQQPPPVRIIVPGKVYRRDNPDATHAFMFHQVEGLAVAEDITFCDFKGTIEYFLREFFGPEMRTRFRPSYFPFTEPSAEVDGSCIFCAGAGCRICKHTGWIELFGAGMVHPAVYEFVGYDATKVNGFAFGIGVDRFAMLKYGVDDMQLFFQNDSRFLQQFRR